MKTLWLYLYFPDLFLHRLEGSNTQPLAILNPADLRILQFNQQARKASIQADMSLPTALSLCPNLQTHPLNKEHELGLLTQEAIWASQFSAQISLDPPDGMWLEIGSMLKLFNGLEAFWQQVLSNRNDSLPMKLACSQIPAQAKYLARAGIGQPINDAHWIRQQIDQLPLSSLPQSQINPIKLQRIGARRLGDLLKLPPSGIATRYGKALFVTLQQLQGNLPVPMSWFQPPLTFEQPAYFVEEIEYLGGLIFRIQPLLQTLSALLKPRQLATRHIRLELKHRHKDSTHWEFRFARSTADYDELQTLIRYQLDRQTLPAPVIEFVLRAKEFEQASTQQADYWPESKPLAEAGSSLLNRLQARLEDHQLLQLNLTHDARPEVSGQLSAASLKESNQRRSLETTTRLSAIRPCWLAHPPIPCSEPNHQATKSPLPERISTGWWDSYPLRRDYYQVYQNGQLLWLFRDHQARWFLHGWFG